MAKSVWYYDQVKKKKNITLRRKVISSVLKNPGESLLQCASDVGGQYAPVSFVCRQLEAEGMLVMTKVDKKTSLFFFNHDHPSASSTINGKKKYQRVKPLEHKKTFLQKLFG